MRAIFGLMGLLLVTMTHAVDRQEPIEIEKGRSPDGQYLVRVTPPGEAKDFVCVEVIHVSTKVVVGWLPEVSGYARFPELAQKENTVVLWSPDSKHVAIMGRTTKRTWNLSVYAVGGKEIKLVPLPSATEEALKLQNATEIDRVLSERPVKWLDANKLLVLASGDFRDSEGGENIAMQYEVHVTYSISERKVAEVSLLKSERKDE